MPRPLQDRNIARLEESSEERSSAETRERTSAACKTTAMQLADTAIGIREMTKKIGTFAIEGGWDGMALSIE